MKNSFSLLETIFLILLISLLSSYIYFKPKQNKLKDVVKRLELYLKQTRYQSLIDNKKDMNDNLWHRKRWTLKFFRCSSNIGGFYYVIYSDTNKKGHPNENESLLDPLSKKRVFSTNKCEYTKTRSKYVLLTKEFDVKNIEVSCNNTSSIGQLSFGEDGRVFTKLSTKPNEFDKFELKRRCEIKFIDFSNNFETLIVEPKTGYSYIKN